MNLMFGSSRILQVDFLSKYICDAFVIYLVK